MCNKTVHVTSMSNNWHPKKFIYISTSGDSINPRNCIITTEKTMQITQPGKEWKFKRFMIQTSKSGSRQPLNALLCSDSTT